MAKQREQQHLRGLRDAHQARLRILERQEAAYGLSVEPHILTEIEEKRTKIAEIDAILAPPPQIPHEVWTAMDADDQRRYLVALVMELQADFVHCRMRLNREVKLWIGATLAVLILVFLVLAAHAYMMRGVVQYGYPGFS